MKITEIKIEFHAEVVDHGFDPSADLETPNSGYRHVVVGSDHTLRYALADAVDELESSSAFCELQPSATLRDAIADSLRRMLLEGHLASELNATGKGDRYVAIHFGRTSGGV
jgi:hypothetical protein